MKIIHKLCSINKFTWKQFAVYLCKEDTFSISSGCFRLVIAWMLPLDRSFSTDSIYYTYDTPCERTVAGNIQVLPTKLTNQQIRRKQKYSLRIYYMGERNSVLK